jgi:hypothetical protein
MREPKPDPDDPIEELDATYRASSDPDGFGGSVGQQFFTRPPEQAEPRGGLTNTLPQVTNSFDQGRFSRHPSGNNELMYWHPDGGGRRITRDARNDLAPDLWGDTVVWQKAKSWPFGWEIMVLRNELRYQLTTNYYYDMAPKIHDRLLTWYGWDGHDFEIYLHDTVRGGVTQITSNHYDDVSPVIWNGALAWEDYPAVEADIYYWKDGVTRKLSNNIEDDLNPRIWNDQIVWQGFDGDDFEIYLSDGEKTIKLTSNIYDDIGPEIRDGLITWTGYHDNWDAEIFVWDGSEVTQLSTNEYEDRNPRTAGGVVVWQAELLDDRTHIYRAERR